MRWSNPLPGCEAFSRHAKQDQRIDIAALQRLCGRLPEDPRVLRSIAQEAGDDFGIYAEVLTPGRISLGDRLTLVAA